MDFDLLLLIATTPIMLLALWDLIAISKKAYTSAFKEKKVESKPIEDSDSSAESSAFSKIMDQVWRFRLPLLHIIVILFSAWVINTALSPTPRIESSYPTWEGRWESYNKPLELHFNVPVQTSSLKPFLSNQELDGEWRYEPYLGFLPVTRVAKFFPATTLPPDRRLVAYMTGVKRIGVDEYHEHPLNLFTHLPTEVLSTSPLHNTEEVATETTIVFKLNRNNEGLADWTFESEPEFEFVLTQPNDNTFVINPKEKLSQTETYKISVNRTPLTRSISSGEILDRDNEELVHELIFSTVRAPLIKKFTPSGTGVMVNTEIDIEFEVAMSTNSVESLLGITPAIDATLIWNNSSNLIVRPNQDLPKDTRYVISFPAGLASESGGLSEIPIERTFTTIGAVRVSKFAPKNNAARVLRNTSIKVVFDQEIDHASAESKFSISPTAKGKFTWKNNTMAFKPSKNLAFNTNYTIRVASGVKTVLGLDSKQAFTSKFKTVPNQTIIAGFSAGTWDRQDFNFSCGIAATKMALTWKGISVSESHLIYNQIGVNNSSMSCSGGTCHWGDPNKKFLGDPNGSGTYGTGQNAYGVHWQPIINVYNNNYGISTELKRGWNVRGLAKTINEGHPVQIWWWNGVSSLYGSSVSGGTRIDWIAPDGRQIEAIHGMHSILVVGFTGDPNNPTGFIVQDPWWGFNTYPVSKFHAQWPKLNNTGVIIY